MRRALPKKGQKGYIFNMVNFAKAIDADGVDHRERVEGATFSVYFNDIDKMFELIDRHNVSQYVIEVRTPISDEAKDAVLRGEVLVSKELASYGHKVMLRSNSYDSDSGKRMNDFLANLPQEEYKMTNRLRNEITYLAQAPGRQLYLFNKCIYFKSDQYATMLTLMLPGNAVKSCIKLTERF